MIKRNINKVLVVCLIVAILLVVLPRQRAYATANESNLEPIATTTTEAETTGNQTASSSLVPEKQGGGQLNTLASATTALPEAQDPITLSDNVQKAVALDNKVQFDNRASNSTKRISLNFIRIENNKAVELANEWFTQQVVDPTINLDISGNDYVIEQPYLEIKITKTDKIKNVVFNDSVAGTTERIDDDPNYYIVRYKFPRLTGGTSNNYPFTFQFDGHHALANDEVRAEATLYDANSKSLISKNFVFKAKTLPFTVDSDLYTYSMRKVSYADNPNKDGHIFKGIVDVDKPGDKKSSQYVTYTPFIKASIYPAKQKGVKGEGIGAVYPKNIKIVFTYPDKQTGLTPNAKGTEVYGGEKKKNSYKCENQVEEVIIEKPTFNNGVWDNILATKTYSKLAFKQADLDTELKVKIDFYLNVDENGENGKLVGSRYESLILKGEEFKQNGNFSYDKSFGGYEAAEEFGYIYNSNYYCSNKEIYKGMKSMSEKGIPFKSEMWNRNNGSSFANKNRGGIISQINEIVSILDTSGIYYKSVQFRTYNQNYNEKDETCKANKDALIKTMNENNTRLYGISAGGKETLIKEHVQYDELVQIEDKDCQYKQLALRFEKPITLDNMTLKLNERVWFTAKELDEINNLTDMKTKKYDTSVKVSSKTGEAKDFAFGRLAKTFITVQALHPMLNEYISNEQTVVYKQGSTFKYLVGPRLPETRAWADDATLGNLKVVKNVKSITLIPAGFEYRNYSTNEESFDWFEKQCWEQFKGQLKVTTVPNFQASGKTAVIVDYGDLEVNKRYPLVLNIEPTKFAEPGKHEFVNFLTYADNDFIWPSHSKDDRSFFYEDALDLDQDGNTQEVFIKKLTNVNFIPAQEASLTNKVAEGEVGAKNNFTFNATGDLGGDIQLSLNFFNNNVTNDIKQLTILDVLPDRNDHSVAPNDHNEYPQRGSTMALSLTKALEDVQVNQEVLKKFTVYYQTAKQGKNLASVRDGAWLTKEQITDFRQVKSIKLVMNAGCVIEKNTGFTLLLPAKLPEDKQLDEKKSRAYNSAAFSLDGGNSFTEGNKTEISFVTYLIKGLAFYDLDQDGKYLANKDKLAAGVTVQLLRKSTQAMSSKPNDNIPAGWELAQSKLPNTSYTAMTNSKGEYCFSVYEHCNKDSYMLLFTKPDGQTFSKKVSSEPSALVSDLKLDKLDEKSNSAVAKEFTLDPITKEAVRNVALLLTKKTSIPLVVTPSPKPDDKEQDKVFAHRPLKQGVVAKTGEARQAAQFQFILCLMLLSIPTFIHSNGIKQ